MTKDQTGIFKLLQGLQPVGTEARDALADFEREMTEHAIPEIIKEDEKRRMLAAESRHRRLERPKEEPPSQG
jgi:hypothetical protein